ncbi:regulatory protein RecX [Haloechinothrix sp. LS1_15]|uniref:regulatory protein RecX n=1 Tax=Haloechinothrix sp. LS1_15 TaxID=2652248 RepID=UPI002946CC36|nr:regulatory protein RecX [Haloechinothrix sp. LS1_15]MDV6014505.1 regulatory protein RecX [Haloechinothrix sp. LS1_15]
MTVGSTDGEPPGSEPAASTTDAAAADGFRQAKDVCLRQLASRPRTREELRSTLVGKGFDTELVEGVLDRLAAARLVDDAEFAESWVRSRHTHQGLGRRALRAELLRKGVEAGTAEEALAGLDDTSEEERARALVRKRLPSLRRVDQTTALRRLVALLARKGYPEGVAYTVASEELGAAREREM